MRNFGKLVDLREYCAAHTHSNCNQHVSQSIFELFGWLITKGVGIEVEKFSIVIVAFVFLVHLTVNSILPSIILPSSEIIELTSDETGG